MEIYQKAFDIIERYFGTEEEDKDVSSAGCVPKMSSANIFTLLRWFPSRQRTSFLLARPQTANNLSRASISKDNEVQSCYKCCNDQLRNLHRHRNCGDMRDIL